MKDTQKQALVKMFVNGQHVSDIAGYFCAHTLTVEAVLREAIVGLARLNEAMMVAVSPAPDPEVVAALQIALDQALGTAPASTPDMPEGHPV